MHMKLFDFIIYIPVNERKYESLDFIDYLFEMNSIFERIIFL